MISASKIYKYGFFVLIVAIAVIITLDSGADANEQYLNTLREKIEALENANSRLKAENDSISSELTVLQDSVLILRQDNIDLDNKRRSAIGYYRKLIKSREALTTHKLDSLLISRYEN